MDEETRRKLERGRRALKFSRAHPDQRPGYAALVKRLEALLARAEELERQEKLEQQEARGQEPPRTGGGPVGYGKVIPLRRRPEDDPTDPAA